MHTGLLGGILADVVDDDEVGGGGSGDLFSERKRVKKVACECK